MELVGITGANGFIGRRLCSELVQRGRKIRALSRNADVSLQGSMCIGSIGPHTDWGRALSGVSTLIHCAAHVHQLRQPDKKLQHKYSQVNRDGTIRLAQHAVAAGVNRLIFLSSIKVNGQRTAHGLPFLESSVPCPVDAYANSKWEAEQALWDVGRNSDLEIVIIRPPLVYGPGVKANFQILMKLISKGIPLPLEGINNRRSFVAIDNLIDLLICCVDHPHAAGSTFLVSDDQDLSTPQLIRTIAMALDQPPRLFSVPLVLLRSGAIVLGRSEMLGRLVDSLQVDISHTKLMLDWNPPLTVRQGLKLTADDWRGSGDELKSS